MSIQDDTKGTTAMGAAMNRAGAGKGAAQPQAPQPQAPQYQAPQQGAAPQYQAPNQSNEPLSFAMLGTDITKAIPLSQSGEALARAQKAIQQTIDSYKEEGRQINTTLIAVDMNEMGGAIPVSYLVLAVEMTKAGKRGVGYQPIIIEGSIEKPMPVDEFIQGVPGGKVQVMKFVSDADNMQVRNTIAQIVADRFGTNEVYGALALVLPRDFNLDDQMMVKTFTSNVAYAAALELQRHNGLQPLNLAAFANSKDTLAVKLSFDPRQVTNLVGHPVISHIKLDLVAEPVNKQQNQVFGGLAPSTLLARSSAFIDVIYEPAQRPQAVVPGMAQFSAPTPDMWQKYVPRCVLTNLEAERLRTLEGQLMALAGALGIRNNNAWMGTFLPDRTPGQEVDIRDVGALNIEANWLQDPNVTGAPLDIKADSFTTGNLMQYLSAIFRRSADGTTGLAFAIDILERGPDTWYNGVLAAADDGDPDAIRAIIVAADNLTGGAFSQIFPAGADITRRMGERVHMGYYKNRNGEVRDIRDIGYIAMMNIFGVSNLDLVRDYSDTVVKTSFPEAQRLAARATIIEKVTGNAVFTGMARRVTLTKEFTDALVQAVEATRVRMPIQAPYLDTTTQERGVGNFAGSLVGTGTSQLYNRTFNTPANPAAAGGQQFTNRWGV